MREPLIHVSIQYFSGEDLKSKSRKPLTVHRAQIKLKMPWNSAPMEDIAVPFIFQTFLQFSNGHFSNRDTGYHNK